ncbi:MAG: hypothetical protein LIO72_00520, partial [Ruminococcus sp.]|nr:hypothetical protein [Ruminococcus sp.]
MTTIAGASASGIVSDTGILVILNSDSSLASSYTYALCQQDNTDWLSIFPSFNINVTSTNYTVEWYSSQTNSTEGGTLIGSNAEYTLYSSGGFEVDNLGDAGTTTYYYYVLTVTDTSTGEELAVEKVGPLAFTVEEHTIVLQGVKDATCTEVGNLGDGYCTSCSRLVWEGVRTDPTGHTWDEGTVTTEATCSENGVMTYTCTVCGETSTEEIPAGHTEGETVVENEVEATCTTDGSYDEVVYCTGCGEELSRYTISVPATGHTAADPIVENNVPATCTTDGSYDNVVYCSVCDEELSRETITVLATGHTEGEAVVENEVEATCTEDGSYES